MITVARCSMVLTHKDSSVKVYPLNMLNIAQVVGSQELGSGETY